MDPFVPLADEPTVAPLPVPFADESALTPMTAPATPVPPTPVDKKGKVPTWLIILGVIAVILMITLPVAFLLQNRNDEGDTAAVEPTVPLEAVVLTEAISSSDEVSGVLPTVVPSPSAQAVTATEQPIIAPVESTATASATTPPPDTPAPQPTPTLAATPDGNERRGCANNNTVLFVWNDTQFNAGCSSTMLALEVGDEVKILNDLPRSPGGTCGLGRFIKIQSAANSTLEGWVHEGVIDEIATGESCSP
jgi:hypothetical protein